VKRLLSFLLVLVLVACDKSPDAGAAYLGAWVHVRDPGYEVVITRRQEGGYLLTWNRRMLGTKVVSSSSHDADLVNSKLMSPSGTTFIRDDGVLVFFGQGEYTRKR
jgi:hypothetical protein